ncbi:hypothetical protein DM860_000313 [Cuscuta australis]|uniref:EF-hand domain-containing protein n=1 Tax=Cuscuta australis TaxID=267555 RepID=A0A328CZU0_9ASTE|nr:hypothetical protein DM860_000313 [Cuscuta australis]
MTFFNFLQFLQPSLPDDNTSVPVSHLKEVLQNLGMAWEDDDDDGEETGNFTVSRQELAAIVGPDEEASVEEAKRCFDVFDEDGNGFIEACELQRVMACLGMEEGRELEDGKKMILAVDENGDGVVDFQEFAKLLQLSLK